METSWEERYFKLVDRIANQPLLVLDDSGLELKIQDYLKYYEIPTKSGIRELIREHNIQLNKDDKMKKDSYRKHILGFAEWIKRKYG